MLKSNRLTQFLAIMLVLFLAVSLTAGDWPQWRGEARDGKSTDTGLLKSWPDGGPELVWNVTGFGQGFSSVSVVGDRVYTLGEKGGENHAFALSAKDGSVIWSTSIGKGGAHGGGRWDFYGPRASATVDGDLLFTVDQQGKVTCLSAKDGKVMWSKHFQDDFGGVVPRWGFTESALVDGNQVVVTPGGAQGALAALNKKNGELIWQSKEFPDSAHYSSLVLAEFGGVRQVVAMTEKSVAGVAARDGKLLWHAERAGRVAVIPTPIVDGDYVYVTSGYNVGSHLYKIESNGGAFTATEQLHNAKGMINQHGGTVKVGDVVFGYHDGKGLVCQDFLTGDIVWNEREKLKKGAVSYADGMLYCREEGTGTIILVEAVKTGYSEKGRFEQPGRSDQMAWVHPVIANGRLYINDQDRILCYKVK